MMIAMQDADIQGPRARIPGSAASNPFYQSNISDLPAPNENNNNNDGPGPQSGSLAQERSPRMQHHSSILRRPSNMSHTSRARGESISAMSKRVDFSLGMQDMSSGDQMGDIHDNGSRPRVLDSRSRERNRMSEVPEEDTQEKEPPRRSVSQRSRFGIHRASTESQTRLKSSPSVSHRNRFFSRRRGSNSGQGEYEDLMEQGMADIPESRAPSDPMDPRTGTIGSQAMRQYSSTSASNRPARGSVSTTVSGVRGSEDAGQSGPRQQEFEMIPIHGNR